MNKSVSIFVLALISFSLHAEEPKAPEKKIPSFGENMQKKIDVLFPPAERADFYNKGLNYGKELVGEFKPEFTLKNIGISTAIAAAGLKTPLAFILKSVVFGTSGLAVACFVTAHVGNQQPEEVKTEELLMMQKVQATKNHN